MLAVSLSPSLHLNVMIQGIAALALAAQGAAALRKWRAVGEGLARAAERAREEREGLARAEARQDAQRETAAASAASVSRLRRGVRTWAEATARRKAMQSREATARAAVTQRCLSHFFGHWRQATSLLRNAAVDAAGLYQRNLLRKCLGCVTESGGLALSAWLSVSARFTLV